MNVDVVIAYRDMGCEHRRRSFAYVLDWYDRCGYRAIVESGESDDQFTRASAINTAVRRSRADVIIQSDPDSLVDPIALVVAAFDARASDGLVVAHSRYLYLSRVATDEVINHGLTLANLVPGDCDTYGTGGYGNVVAFSRATWEQVGGFDERFGVWGGDDAAFAYACEAMVAPTRRIPGDMVHLWHPRLPQSEPGGPGYADQFAILAQYRDAHAIGPDAVAALVRSR